MRKKKRSPKLEAKEREVCVYICFKLIFFLTFSFLRKRNLVIQKSQGRVTENRKDPLNLKQK